MARPQLARLSPRFQPRLAPLPPLLALHLRHVLHKKQTAARLAARRRRRQTAYSKRFVSSVAVRQLAQPPRTRATAPAHKHSPPPPSEWIARSYQQEQILEGSPLPLARCRARRRAQIQPRQSVGHQPRAGSRVRPGTQPCVRPGRRHRAVRRQKVLWVAAKTWAITAKQRCCTWTWTCTCACACSRPEGPRARDREPRAREPSALSNRASMLTIARERSIGGARGRTQHRQEGVIKYTAREKHGAKAQCTHRISYARDRTVVRCAGCHCSPRTPQGRTMRRAGCSSRSHAQRRTAGHTAATRSPRNQATQ